MNSDEPNPNKFYKWVVEIEVNEVWVADGFDLTDERAHDMITSDLGYAYSHEIKAKVISSPNRKDIRKAQGYPD